MNHTDKIQNEIQGIERILEELRKRWKTANAQERKWIEVGAKIYKINREKLVEEL